LKIWKNILRYSSGQNKFLVCGS